MYIYIMENKQINTPFEAGKSYQMSFIGDSELRPVYACVKRTEKSATFKAAFDGEVITKKIRVNSGVEYVVAGSYSMAPTISAARKV